MDEHEKHQRNISITEQEAIKKRTFVSRGIFYGAAAELCVLTGVVAATQNYAVGVAIGAAAVVAAAAWHSRKEDIRRTLLGGPMP